MDFEIQIMSLLGAFPVIAVWLVGGFLCLQHQRLQPRACTLIGIALLIALGTRVVMPFVHGLLWQLIDNAPFFGPGGFGRGNIGLRVLLNAFLYAVPSALVWGLVLWAVFGPGGLVSPHQRWQEEADWEEPRRRGS